MNNARIQQLIRFIQDEPGDPFNVYALAMEYVADEPRQAMACFDDLLTRFPDYLPTYYHAAALCIALDERDRAAGLYEAGIALARRQQNQKTLHELLQAQRALADEEDDW
jgi:predicted RNA polymerase sigma factor